MENVSPNSLAILHLQRLHHSLIVESQVTNKCTITTSFDCTVQAIKWKSFSPLIA